MSANIQRRAPLIIPPPKPPSQPSEAATLIFIHGYTYSAHRFNHDPPNHKSVAHHIHKSPALQHLKIVIPEGLPIIWPEVKGHTWYSIDQPIPSPGDPSKVDVFGQHNSDVNDIETSLDYFESLIDIEISNGVSPNRIVFMGDSQGASILYLFLLTRTRAADLGAVITWAGFSAVSLETVAQMQERRGLRDGWAKETRLFMLHGKEDVFVPVSRAEALAGALERYRVRGHGFAGLEVRILEGLRHTLEDGVWSPVREILEGVVPLGDLEPTSKL
ncbi:acyl- thioesterase 1 protein [Rutstroemia sp. NJR-2017a BBW]|nr:acyl- thioesterase 1 protein [Rutstroemia sp. NJR-2017a BBW]